MRHKCHRKDNMNREQELVDICFSIGILMSDLQYDFIKMDNEQKAEYIAKQLRECGFDTQPCGASWGVLK